MRRATWRSRAWYGSGCGRAGAIACAAPCSRSRRLLNYRRFGDRWRVSLDGLEKGDVRVVLSVLYDPFAEMDLDGWPGSRPQDGYYRELLRQLDTVQAELTDLTPAARAIKSLSGLRTLRTRWPAGAWRSCTASREAFHLGGTVADVERHVAELADRGVVYVTLAHLFWRQVATNAPALPFLSDRLYDRLFHQPSGVGLSDLGRAAVRAMYAHRVLVDVSHMRQAALDETFALLEDLDREHGADPRDFPVIASHGGFRFGK